MPVFDSVIMHCMQLRTILFTFFKVSGNNSFSTCFLYPKMALSVYTLNYLPFHTCGYHNEFLIRVVINQTVFQIKVFVLILIFSRILPMALIQLSCICPFLSRRFIKSSTTNKKSAQSINVPHFITRSMLYYIIKFFCRNMAHLYNLNGTSFFYIVIENTLQSVTIFILRSIR